MPNWKELRDRAYEGNMELSRKNIVLYTFGNASEIDRESACFAIKPSGVPYESLKPSDIVIVDLEGRIVDGSLRPSSDTKTHAVLYRNLPDIGGIVHTHSTYATAWAQAGQAIPCYGTTHADYVFGEVPCTAVMSDKQVERDYEEETGQQILETVSLSQPSQSPMILVASHGPFAWGKNAKEAVYHAVMLEELAKMAWITRSLNAETPHLKSSIHKKHYLRKHGSNSYYGQSVQQ